jgi:tRNA-2-methylthio-N6-dimethylallyladenosine synthase
VKRRRNNELLEVQSRTSREDNGAFVGRELAIFVEGPSKASVELGESGPLRQMTGRTWCDRIVLFRGNERLAGTVAIVGITGSSAVTLTGEIVTTERPSRADSHAERAEARVPASIE